MGIFNGLDKKLASPPVKIIFIFSLFPLTSSINPFISCTIPLTTPVCIHPIVFFDGKLYFLIY